MSRALGRVRRELLALGAHQDPAWYERLGSCWSRGRIRSRPGTKASSSAAGELARTETGTPGAVSAGYAAVRLTEANENWNRQHQNLRTENGIDYGDLPDFVDYVYAARITGLNAASLASLAWAPSPPQAVRIGGGLSTTTTVTWQAGPGAPAAGYKIYWRDTIARQWTHSRWVGNVTECRLQNVLIDDHVFGVAAVSADGNESVIVFPGTGRPQ